MDNLQQDLREGEGQRWAVHLDPSVVGKFASILLTSQAVTSAVSVVVVVVVVGGFSLLECQCQKQAGLLPFQLMPFPSIVLTELENDAAKRKT